MNIHCGSQFVVAKLSRADNICAHVYSDFRMVPKDLAVWLAKARDEFEEQEKQLKLAAAVQLK
jgi:hypothetical protein